MDFRDGCFYCIHGVAQGDRCVGVPPGVKHYAVGLTKSVLVQPVYQVALMVALQI